MKKNRVLITIVAVVAAVALVIGAYALGAAHVPAVQPDASVDGDAVLPNDALYEAAVEDAVFADEDEVMPLVALTADDDHVIWNEAGDKVLLLSWHHYPDSYPAGEDIVLEWGEAWTVSAGELAAWYDDHHEGVTDWTLRLEQLLGLPEGKGHTHFTAMWVDPADALRPAYESDPTAPMTTVLGEDEEADEWFAPWFDSNIVWSYFDAAYPWTRLGYTYDWAAGDTEYGLTEFLVLPNATTRVEFTKSNEELVAWLAEQ